MRVGVTATGPELDSLVDQRFGRAEYLLFVDLPERALKAVENKAGRSAAQGAGIQAAQVVIDNRATVLITGHCGPKAYQALKAAGVEVFVAAGGTVDEVLSRFQEGKLSPAPAADVGGRW